MLLRGSLNPMQCWSNLAQVAWLTGDLDLAREVYEALRGKELGLDLGWLQVAYGVLARMLGKMDEAVERLRSAGGVAGWAVLRLVRTTHVLAETLATRDAPGDRREAELLWKEALELAVKHGLVPLASRIQAELEGLGSTAARSHPDGLTDRELEVLRLIAAGKTNKEIGLALFISERTVENHVTRIFAKTRTTNRTEAAVYARSAGMAHEP